MEGESDVWFAVGSERQHPLIIHFCLNDYRCFYFFRSGGEVSSKTTSPSSVLSVSLRVLNSAGSCLMTTDVTDDAPIASGHRLELLH